MEKRFKGGLVLGKFMPPHNGHLHLINSAAEKCEIVYVMICSLKSEPINGILRYNWLKTLYDGQDNIKIIHCQDENPQKPDECESTDIFYIDYWIKSVYSRIKHRSIDVVFTSEEYGDEFAYYLGVEHVLVDIDRTTFPVSGTKVRENPFTNWNFIPDVVKPYFTKRIVIMGPESTGKSTLIKRLADHYSVDYIEEYGRKYTETIKKGKDLEVEDFFKIATEHNENILENHTNSLNKLLFVDTEAITTKLFGEMYIDGYKDDRIDEIIQFQWFDLYLLMDVDVPWINDGTRDFPNENDRKKHFNMIKSELDRLNKKYVIITGDYDQRFELSKKEVENLGYL